MHLLSAQRSNEGYLDEKNFAAAYVGVRFRHSPNQFQASDEVETLKCTIIADAITGNTLYETGECARRVSPCSSFKLPLAIMGFDSGILQSPKSPTWELKPEYNPSPRDRTYKQVYPALWQSDSVV